MTQFAISKEEAESEFERFAEAMDLDLDTDYMDESDLNGFMRQKSRVIKALQRGSLVINQQGEAEYTPQNPETRHQETLTFHERTGAAILAMDGKKKNHDVAKMYSVLASLCRVDPKVFAGMVGIDGKVCEALFTFLMD